MCQLIRLMRFILDHEKIHYYFQQICWCYNIQAAYPKLNVSGHQYYRLLSEQSAILKILSNYSPLAKWKKTSRGNV